MRLFSFFFWLDGSLFILINRKVIGFNLYFIQQFYNLTVFKNLLNQAVAIYLMTLLIHNISLLDFGPSPCSPKEASPKRAGVVVSVYFAGCS